MDIVIEFLRKQAKSFKEEVNKVIQKEDKKNE